MWNHGISTYCLVGGLGWQFREISMFSLFLVMKALFANEVANVNHNVCEAIFDLNFSVRENTKIL